MKRTLSTIFTAALLAVSMILAVGAAHLKTDIAGNMAIGGNFDSGEEHAKSHFWFGRSDDVNPYRGTTIVYQSKGGVADSGCLRINGTDAGAPGLCYADSTQDKNFLTVQAGKKYIAFIDVYVPTETETLIWWGPENKDIGADNVHAMTNNKEGSWVSLEHDTWTRLSYVFTAAKDGDLYYRVTFPWDDLKNGEFILVDNFYVGLYDEKVDYNEMVPDVTPPTPDTADTIAISAVAAVVVLTGICVTASKKKTAR